MAYVPDAITCTCVLHRLIEALFSDRHEPQGLIAYLADSECSCTVAIIAAVASPDVDLYDVSLSEDYSVRGYSVYDLIVY